MKIIKLQNNNKDLRGSISDILYKKKVKHISLIVSNKGAIRGNNYFKKNVQYIFNLSSSFEYWYKKLGSKKKPKRILVKKNDLLFTPKLEIHASKFMKKNKLLEFSTLSYKEKKRFKDSIRHILIK